MSRTVTDSFPISNFNNIQVNTSILSNPNNYYTYSSRNVKYVVIHYTGNSSDSAVANANYFHQGSRGASAHYFVDNSNCYQSVALHNAAWAVGGTQSYKHADCRNSNSISIEMCCSGNYRVSEQTITNTAYLCAKLCKYLNISASQVDTYVLRHYDVWNKSCPAQWANNNSAEWRAFKEKVKQLLNSNTESEDGLTMSQYQELNDRLKKLENPMIYNYIDSNMPNWAHQAVQWCMDKGIISGTGQGLGLDDQKIWVCTIIYRLAKQLGA